MPFLPQYLQPLYRITCLFIYKENEWGNYYLQVRLEGNKDWKTIPESDYSKLKPTGHLTRTNLILAYSRRQRHGRLQKQRLAEFIKERYEALNPGQPTVESVRFLYVHYQTGEEELANPMGCWQRPPLETVPVSRQYPHSTHFFDGRVPLDWQGREVPFKEW